MGAEEQGRQGEQVRQGRKKDKSYKKKGTGNS
jgi:hypothetical protein